MKYTIISINDKRKHYKDNINGRLMGHWDYFDNINVDGNKDIDYWINKYGYNVNYLPEYGEPKVGHLGVWFSVINSLEFAPHITFEDDALLNVGIVPLFQARLAQVPDDADFFSLFIPRDSDHMFDESMSVGDSVTKVYQRYGGVSMYYTESGAARIKDLLERDGITGQYDDTLYRYAKAGELNGYCSKPTVSDLVYITGNEESIVQETKHYEGI